MARCEALEAILQAQFESEYAEPETLEEQLRRQHTTRARQIGRNLVAKAGAWDGAAQALATLHPSGEVLVLHAAQGRELWSARAAALVFVENPLPLCACAPHPAQDDSLDGGRQVQFSVLDCS